MKKWLEKLFRDEEMAAELQNSKRQIQHIRDLATALVKTASFEEVGTTIVNKCQSILSADAVCIYTLQPAGYYEMIAELGCTQRFKEEWLRIYPEKIPLLDRKTFREPIFMGSALKFKQHIKDSSELVDHSKRQSIAYAPLIIGDQPIGLIGFSYNSSAPNIDVDFLKTLMSICAEALERGRLFELERRARLEAKMANDAKTEFLTNISHEIRAPITAICGFAELLAHNNGLKQNESDWLSRILRNSQHLTGLVGDVLDLSKIESERIEVCQSTFSLADLIDDVKAVTTFKAEEKNVALTFHLEKVPTDIWGDVLHLRQILINLIGNSVKFTPPHGSVDVFLSHSEGLLEVDVKDTGNGIAPEDQELIFERFKTIDSNGENSFGLGLGLAISKKLAKALGGDLVLKESVVGEGSWFRATIPCRPAERHQKSILKNVDTSIRGKRVLLVEDSKDNRDLMSYVLTNEGAIVDTADNGVMGLELARMGDFDIVIMDIRMPELDGNKAISTLRASGYKKPVIALTAEAMSSQREESLQRGFDDYLTKPVNSKHLIKTIARLT